MKSSHLTSLFYIKELRDFFIEKEKYFSDEQKICKVFAEIMNELKYGEKDYINPEKLKKLLGEKNILFSGNKTDDLKDLFSNLIKLFLTELSEKNKTDISNKETYSSELYCNNKIKMFEETLIKIEEKNNIINELFIGYYENMYYCNIKRQFTYSFQTDSFIIFELEKIQKYFGTNKLSLKLCFEFFSRQKENSTFYCNRCGITHNGDEYQTIYRPPKILVLILDRGHGKTFQGEVEINKQLILKDIIDEENYKYSSIYELICVSTHEGDNSSKGHYTSCCLTDNKKYYYFSDTHVKEIKEDNLFHDEPYLLFYRQSDNSLFIEYKKKDIIEKKKIELKMTILN